MFSERSHSGALISEQFMRNWLFNLNFLELHAGNQNELQWANI